MKSLTKLLFLPDESSKVLDALSKFEGKDAATVPEAVDMILNLVGGTVATTAITHLPAFRFAKSYFEKHAKWPDLRYLRQSFPELGFDIEAGDNPSLCLLEDFIHAVRTEIFQTRGQDALAEGDLKKLSALLDEVNIAGRDTHWYTAEDAYNDYLKSVEDGVPPGIETKIAELDAVVRRLSFGTLTVVAAPPSMGKTSFAVNTAYSAIRAGHKVLFLTFEIPKKNLQWDFISRHATFRGVKLPAEELHKGTLPAESLPVLKQMTQEWHEMSNGTGPRGGRLLLMDSGDFLTFDRSTLQRVWREVDKEIGGLEVIVVDYIQLLRYFRPKEVEASAFVNDLVTYFALLAKNFNERGLQIMLLSQVNREGQKRLDYKEGEKGADQTILAEFNALERDAHVIIALYASLKMRNEGTLKLQVIKNRTGRVMSEMVSIGADFAHFALGNPSYDDAFQLDHVVSTGLGLDDGVPGLVDGLSDDAFDA